MEKIIKQLIEIEEKANKIMLNANDEKSNLNDSFELDVNKMEKEISAENARKISSLKAQADSELAMEREQLVASSKEQLRKLQEHYRKNNNTIVQDIFENIINS